LGQERVEPECAARGSYEYHQGHHRPGGIGVGRTPEARPLRQHEVQAEQKSQRRHQSSHQSEHEEEPHHQLKPQYQRGHGRHPRQENLLGDMTAFQIQSGPHQQRDSQVDPEKCQSGAGENALEDRSGKPHGAESYAGHGSTAPALQIEGTLHPGGAVRVRDIMTPDPVFCTPTASAEEAATLMRDHDCGSIPVVDNAEKKRLVGTVTDRDLAVRGLASGKGPETSVRELMTPNPVSCGPDDEVEVVREVMVAQLVRRVPVVDADGRLVGIVAQADIAREEGAASDQEVGRIVEAISDPRGDLKE
jgi:CBS domain-containing protein